MTVSRKALVVLLVLGILGASFVPASAAGISGAIYTTDISCSGVNVNLFASKQDVYLNGGPVGGGPGLPDGDYYVQVTDPSGGTVLGSSVVTSVHVTNGSFDACYQLWDIVYSALSGFTVKGYDDTPSPGGTYKVWVSQDSAFPNSLSKTDNFKVQAGVTPANLHVRKFYDANADGINNDGIYIDGWKMRIYDGIDWIRYTPVDMLLAPDTYTVDEFMPAEPNWMPTTPTSVEVTIPPDATVEFGNLCLGGGGGRTLGFWSNRNGQALIGGDDLAMLVALNLRNADGSNFDPANKTAFRSWLLSANATNMSYMLSAQLAAMELNVYNGFVDGSALIYAPGTNSANALGFATVNAVMTEANTELGVHGTAYAGDAWRSYQEALKNALDNANNNYTFVQPTPCPFSFPE
jgi:hypothetical protein